MAYDDGDEAAGEAATEKDEVIYIRCGERTKTGWEEFAAGYDTHADAVADVVRTWRNYPNLHANRRESID